MCILFCGLSALRFLVEGSSHLQSDLLAFYGDEKRFDGRENRLVINCIGIGNIEIWK